MKDKIKAWLNSLTWRDYWRALRWSFGFAFLGWVARDVMFPILQGMRDLPLMAIAVIPNISPDTLFWAFMATTALTVWLIGILASAVIHLCFPSETIIRCDGCGRVSK